MRRFITTLCFVAFLSAGLVSCGDNAEDINPNIPQMENGGGGGTQDPPGKGRP